MGLVRAQSRKTFSVLWSLFGVLEVKDGLDGKNCMHWNVPRDALPGSATIGPLALTAVGLSQ